jgi:hypothetical protein
MTNEDNRDQAILLLTVCIVLLAFSQCLMDYQITRLTDAIQGHEQAVEPGGNDRGDRLTDAKFAELDA